MYILRTGCEWLYGCVPGAGAGPSRLSAHDGQSDNKCLPCENSLKYYIHNYIFQLKNKK